MEGLWLNIQILHLKKLSKEDKNRSANGSLLVPITVILEALRKYEIGIPENYFKKYGVYFGIESWLKDEYYKENITSVCEDNTCNLNGSVSIHFGFAQFDSLINDDTYVLMHINEGHPFLKETLWHNKYPAMLFKFQKGDLFYNIIDNISFENPNVPSMYLEVDNLHYLVLPRVFNKSYYVKCIETEEELEPNEISFSGNEEDVKKQIAKYNETKKVLVKKIF